MKQPFRSFIRNLSTVIPLVQLKAIGLFLGFFILALTVYKWDLFDGNRFTIFLYKALILLGFLLFFTSLFSLIKAPWWVGLGVCILLESTAYWYIKQVIHYNQLQGTQDIGILQKWLSYRNAIQFDSKFSQYDSITIYKFQSNLHRQFADIEFDSQILSNSVGLRDDEASLLSPKVIFIGDSFTMGWGINQQETYVQQTEKKLNVKCLNAGISSFGTYREALMLSKLQTDSCKLLVLQYCENDLEENYVRGDTLDTAVHITPELYTQITDGNSINSGYFPMRFSYFFLREKEFIKRTIRPHSGVKKDIMDWGKEVMGYIRGKSPLFKKSFDKKPDGEPTRHAHYFFKSLQMIRRIYKGPIIVTNIDPRSTQSWYMDAFSQEATKLGDPHLHLMPLHTHLTNDCYYVVDDHLNAKGHQKVAEVLVRFIKEKQLL